MALGEPQTGTHVSDTTGLVGTGIDRPDAAAPHDPSLHDAGLHDAGLHDTGPHDPSPRDLDDAGVPADRRPERLGDVRVLMYSHDTFGLGHLRRCRAVAHALVERYKGVSVLIISGSQIAGAFDFRARVDFVKVPSVIKLYSGEYASMRRHIDLDDTLRLREQIIRKTARSYRPDILIVDKEPLGLRGEMERTLEEVRARGCTTVLGLRDVMDAPDVLAREWAARDQLRRMDELYDEVWVYGPEDFWDPLTGLHVPPSLASRIRYTGFLRREAGHVAHLPRAMTSDTVLVTAGGGGDGIGLMSKVLDAIETDASVPGPFLFVPGPFMRADERDEIHARAAALSGAHVVDFEADMENMIAAAAALVGMCGYNTFCEVLSFDVPALFVPRTRPRAEQAIRAARADELGYARMLAAEDADDPVRMAGALHALRAHPRPSHAEPPPALTGLQTVCERVATLTSR